MLLHFSFKILFNNFLWGQYFFWDQRQNYTTTNNKITKFERAAAPNYLAFDLCLPQRLQHSSKVREQNESEIYLRKKFCTFVSCDWHVYKHRCSRRNNSGLLQLATSQWFSWVVIVAINGQDVATWEGFKTCQTWLLTLIHNIKRVAPLPFRIAHFSKNAQRELTHVRLFSTWVNHVGHF